jgi:HSP20 family protein
MFSTVLVPRARSAATASERFFHDFYNLGSELFSDIGNSITFPHVIKKEEDKTVLYADLPGLEEKDISVDFKDDVLSITATYPEEDPLYSGKELSSSFDVRNVDTGGISAHMINGRLKVELPKVKETPATKIKIN